MPLRIETDHLVIRLLADPDLAAFARYRAIPAIAEFQSWSDYTYEDAVELHQKMSAVPFGSEGAWFQLAIEQKDSALLAGDLALHFLDQDQVEIGFTIAPEFHRQGIANEALLALLEHLFETRNIHRVIAITDTRNVASCRFLNKAGFRQEAHFVENIYFKGAWSSEFVFAMLRSEWKGTQAPRA